jgi:hypothetical protein
MRRSGAPPQATLTVVIPQTMSTNRPIIDWSTE